MLQAEAALLTQVLEWKTCESGEHRSTELNRLAADIADL